jgi:predicted mannosyl-3-phosphoglycerate phosphatase (HAD superfamily)
MHTELSPGPERFVPASAMSTGMVVFTAIDGVLRPDDHGPCDGATTALDLLMVRGVPIVLLSHGGAAAVQDFQTQLGLHQPFICEGGASLYIPRGYFEELDGLTAGDDAWEVFHFGVQDPARAVRLLASLYSVRGEEILTVGFGCSWADRTLLAAVDVPVIVRNQSDDHARLLRRVPGAYVTTATGPAGWSEAVLGAAEV